MKSLYINPVTKDIEFDGSGNFRMVDGKDELIQQVRLTIKTNLREWFLNPVLGFDYSTVFVKRPNREEIRSALVEAVDQVEGIDRIENIEIDFDRSKRKLKVFFVAISSEYGEIQDDEVVSV
ncbi:DUF2634 domain-containing protein [Desertibacillus haloalkaliphilus]|uniref:DUF2634 domain-containing protein n=1 Tax=Desertibacillus haloalkaliphilus TaxID=1328930 RepID=UPI001C2655CE|nr:DUF2634 domain-containing protein [Desertibacillus haloalkaliphilus]MBU8908496.1 DUF2634 domain-containing protein [Desertibacillus haloalkaliphilus]